MATTTAEQESSDSKAFGARAYERQLTVTECLQVERTAQQLAHADGFVRLWVQDARSFALDARESDVPSFSLRLHPTLPIAEVRDMIERRFEELSTYRERVDGPLQLFYDGRMLEDGVLLAEYTHSNRERLREEEWEQQQQQQEKDDAPQLAPRLLTWPRPYAGIIWVVPFRKPLPRREIWGSGPR
ncbi:hypothetical protein PINS_up006152 [Pythium insidiosum]|nr:hypothetical protein PINS_up006152 [Pythium insidiosum]